MQRVNPIHRWILFVTEHDAPPTSRLSSVSCRASSHTCTPEADLSALTHATSPSEAAPAANHPVILARQTPHGVVAAAGQGKGKEGVRTRAEMCGSVSPHRQGVHIHPAVQEGLETVFLNQFWLATAQLHLNISFPKA